MNDNSEDEALRWACYELAGTSKFTLRPIDAAEITRLRDKLEKIAREEINEGMARDIALVTKAVRYIHVAHGWTQLAQDTTWFAATLVALLDVARPNGGRTEAEARDFLNEVRNGIGWQLDKA